MTPYHQFTLPPRQPGWPVLGNTIPFMRDPLGSLQALEARQERVVHVRIGGRDQYVLFRPDDVKQVLQENWKNYGRPPSFNVLRLLLGNGLLTSEGDVWLQQRRLMQPAFHRQKLARLTELMADETTAWLDRLAATLNHRNVASAGANGHATTSVNLSAEFLDVTMRIVCRTLFGTSLNEAAPADRSLGPLSKELAALNHLANDRILNPVRFPMHWPTPANRAIRRAGRVINGFIYDIIAERRHAERRNNATEHDDLLDMLLSARDEATGEGMTDAQLRDECVTLFTAGHETTAVAMGWAMHLLAQHPDVQDKIRSEVGEKPLNGSNVGETLRSLPYTGQVVQEVLRLYPPAWIMARLVLADDRFGPYRVPAGSTVLLPQYLLHRDPKLWYAPEQFNPDRFSPDWSRDRHPYAYFPFGGGPRLCIGQQFALMEMQLLLAALLQRYVVESAHNRPPRPQPLITLRSRHDLRFQLRAVQFSENT